MRFFRRQKPTPSPLTPHENLNAAIEIVAHKESTKENADKAKAATAQLQELLDNNGFTLKIVLATNSSHLKQKSHD